MTPDMHQVPTAKETINLLCRNCDEITEHVDVGFRKTLYKCLNCGFHNKEESTNQKGGTV